MARFMPKVGKLTPKKSPSFGTGKGTPHSLSLKTAEEIKPAQRERERLFKISSNELEINPRGRMERDYIIYDFYFIGRIYMMIS